MSIILAVSQTSPSQTAPVVAWGFLAWVMLVGVLAGRLGVFRERSIVGPSRLGPDESTWDLWLILLVAVFVWLFGPAIVRGVVGPVGVNQAIVLQLFFTLLAAATVVIGNVVWRREGLRHMGLEREKISGGLVQGAVGIFLVLPLVYAASMVVVAFWHRMGWPEPKPHPVLELLSKNRNPRMLVSLVVTAVVAAPLLEEMLFRGLLQTALAAALTGRRRTDDSPEAQTVELHPVSGRWIAILITSLLFAMVHLESAFLAPLFLLAVGLGYVYERTGNLWASITMHAMFNGWQMIVFWITLQAGGQM